MKCFELPEIIKPDNGLFFLPNAYISLYNNLKNQKELQELIINNDDRVPNCAIINAHMVELKEISEFYILIKFMEWIHSVNILL